MALKIPIPSIMAEEDVFRKQLWFYLDQGAVNYAQGSGSPSGATTPFFIGQFYFDTAGEAFYIATGTTDSDWKAITS